MSVLYCDSSLVYESRPIFEGGDRDECTIGCWDKLTAEPYKVARLARCVDGSNCAECRRKAGLTDRCPVCGFKIAGKRSTLSVVCRCGATIISCLYDNHRSVVCGISIPMLTENDDVI